LQSYASSQVVHLEAPMFFTPKPVPKRVSGGFVCLMLVMLGVALFAGFDLLGNVDSSGTPATTRVVIRTAGVPIRADAFVTIGQAAIQALTAVITKVVTEWWGTALVLDWMQAVHRVWPSIHRLPGTSPPQP
jgi:hypothetical protein